MSEYTFLLLNRAIALYNVGTIWSHEIDIFRSWKLVGAGEFHRIQEVHWHKLPYWVLAPFGLALLGSFALVGSHPPMSPACGIWTNVIAQVLALVLTGLFWGRWQARLSQDLAGPRSHYLQAILRTHWVRTLLITVAALALLLWAIAIH